MTEKPLLTVSETAELLKISEKSVRSAIRREELPVERLAGRIYVLAAPLRRRLEGRAND